MAANGETARFAFTMQFTHFGVPMKLDMPPKDDVQDVTDEAVREADRSP
jgi:hypothetical protein